MTTDPLRRLLDEQAIRQALVSYARAVDRRDWDLLATVFHPDATDEHGPYRGDVPGLIAWLRAELEGVASTTHQLAQSSFDHGADGSVRVETYATAVHRQARRDGTPVDLTFWVRYVDRFEHRWGAWRIADRRVVLDHCRTDDVQHGAGLAAAFLTGSPDRSDPGYA